MSKKSVDDYITEGMYGLRRPKEAEREYYLGTLRERIVLALTIGEVMSDKGLKFLDEAMREHPNAKLLMNGTVARKFLKQEIELANKYNIPYSTFTNTDSKTDIGAVLAYDHAIHKEKIFINVEEAEPKKKQQSSNSGFLSKVKQWFQ